MSTADQTAARSAQTTSCRITAAVAALGACLALAAPAAAQTIYVDDDAAPGGDGRTWDTALTSIRDAIDIARARPLWERTIHIAGGTYDVVPAGGSAWDSFEPTSAMVFRGGFGKSADADRLTGEWIRDPERFVTVIDGGRRTATTGDDTHVLVRPAANTFSVFDGIVFRNARQHAIDLGERVGMELIGCRFENLILTEAVIRAGGALYLTLDHCHFIGNRSQRAGAVGTNVTGLVWVTSCVFQDNRNSWPAVDGAALCVYSAAGVYVGECTFIDNHATGEGGALNLGYIPSINIVLNRFEGNSSAREGGAINLAQLEEGSSVSLCTFNANSADRGGAIHARWCPDGRIESCLFTANSALEGGGALLADNVNVANCTFVGNHSESDAAGAILIPSGNSGTLTNSIVWGNTTALPASSIFASQIVADPILIENNIIAGASDLSNLPLDPMFRSPSDFRLDPSSPAINLGNKAHIPEWPRLDLDLRPRLSGPFIDAGCYESDSPPPCAEADLGGQPVRGLPNYRIPDGHVNNEDFYTYLDAYVRGDAAADMTRTVIRLDPYFGVPDGIISHTDFFYYLMIFEEGCD